ncbi:hypothetical protein WHR41_08270 [Cladosporium halotolerans]|uniref:Peroxidase n=1 Tax=Cladosporium halotolerans TaxID=1052096 RepID=A0AB34KD70_9PEZI
MKTSSILGAFATCCAATNALDLSDLSLGTSSLVTRLRRAALADNTTAPSGGSCPQVWYDIARDLKTEFFGCNRQASDAIRFAFHDAAGYSSKNQPYAPASGGADGSLLLADSEIARSINDPLQGFRSFLLGKYNQYKSRGVGAADFVQAAGTIGTVSCPGGPSVKTVIGRSDTSNAAPEGTLPQAFGPGSSYDTLIQLWADKGISPRELAALMGAHSVSRAFAQRANGILPGSPQDTTPRQWDVKYYSDTQAQNAPRGVSRFQSDVNLANPATEAGQAFTEFAADKAAWATAFQGAMYKLSILGLSDEAKQNLTDCTGILG